MVIIEPKVRFRSSGFCIIDKKIWRIVTMHYSIGEVSKQTGIAISTLRYYDREGLFPQMERTSGGIRMFSKTEIDVLGMIECLKNSGMPIKEIKQFLDWCKEGDATLQQRRDMFYERLEAVSKQMKTLENTLSLIKYKCWYYETALKAGSEAAVQHASPDEPHEVVRSQC